jgi:hypothetical protein
MLQIQYTRRSRSVILLTFFLTTLIACENAPTRREDLLAQHPEWDAKTINVIRDGKISMGMTKEQVRAAWGRHCSTCPGTEKNPRGESWEYATQVVFFNTEDKVVRLSTK